MNFQNLPFKRNFKTIGISVLMLSCLFLIGCVENQKVEEDLSSISLTEDDVDSKFESTNVEHIKNPFIVEKGKLFEGMWVLEKYENLFYYNISTFIVQQLAYMESKLNASLFIETLEENNTIPGVMNDYIFSNIPVEDFTDQVILKSNITEIDEVKTELLMLVFQHERIIGIFVSGTVDQDELISYAKIVEDRIDLLSGYS